MSETNTTIKDSWMEKYRLVLNHFNKHGTIQNLLPGTTLYQWLSWNKSMFHDGKLNEQQIKMLNDVKMIWDKKRNSTELICELLYKYYELHGDINSIPVDFRFDDYKYINLRNAVMNIKAAYRDNRLPEEYIKKYELIGIIWHQKVRADFDTHFQELVKFKNMYGHCNVPATYKPASGFNLSTWCSRIRCSYDGTSNQIELSNEQIEQLKQLGFQFERNGDLKWMEDYNAAKSILEAYHFNYLELYVNNKHSCIDWCYKQKKTYTIRSKEQQKLLDDINIKNAMSPGQLSDEYKFRQVEKFFAKYGHIFVQKNFIDEDGCNIGNFLQGKRNGYMGVAAYSISEEDIIRLNKMNMAWTNVKEHSDAFDLELVSSYFLNVGIVPVPKDMIYRNVNIWQKIKDIVNNPGSKNGNYQKLRSFLQTIDIELNNNDILMRDLTEINQHFYKFIIALKTYIVNGGNIDDITEKTHVNGYKLGISYQRYKNTHNALYQYYILQILPNHKFNVEQNIISDMELISFCQMILNICQKCSLPYMYVKYKDIDLLEKYNTLINNGYGDRISFFVKSMGYDDISSILNLESINKCIKINL